MSLDYTRIRSAIETALERTAEGEARRSADIAFQMTDWLKELERYYGFCQKPESAGSEAIEKLLIDFLVHVPNHVAAAAKLLVDAPVRDIFEVGAVDRDG